MLLNITLPCRLLIRQETLGIWRDNSYIATAEYSTRRSMIRESSWLDIPIVGGWKFGMMSRWWNQIVSGVSNADMSLIRGWR